MIVKDQSQKIRKLSTGLKVATSRLQRRTFPLAVQIAVTNRCNYKCSYCVYPLRGRNDPTLEQVQDLIKQFVDLGTERFSFVGGEPLLRKDIKDIIKFAKDLGTSVAMVTNGSLVPENIDMFERYIDDACISVDGPEELMDANRVKGSFQDAVRACEMLKEKKVPLHMNCVLTKHNARVETVHFMLKFARKYNARCGFLVVQTVPETSGDVSGLHADREAILNCLDEIIKAHRRGEPVVFSPESYELTRKWPDFTKPRSSTDEYRGRGFPECWAGRYFCNVDADGSIYPCCLTIGQVKSENAYKVGVKQALNRAGQHDCRYCMSPGWIEYNRIFSLEPSALKHVFKHGNI